MGLVIVSGGTSGATDGAVISEGGTRTNPMVFSSLNAVYNLHMRTTSGEADDTVFSMPAELSISFDGITWKSIIDSPSPSLPVGPVNIPIQMKQTVSATTSASSFTTSGTYTSGTAPSQVTGLTIGTLSAASVPLTWNASTDNVGVVRYKVERATAANFGSNLLTLSDAVTGTGYTNAASGGNAPAVGTTYYYRVSAGDAAGNWGAVSSGVSCLVVGTMWFNNFSVGETLNGTYLDSAVAGSGYVGTTRNANQLTIDSDDTTTSAAMLRVKTAIDRSAGVKRRLSFRANVQSFDSKLYFGLCNLVKKATIPTTCDSGNEATNWGAGVAAIDLQGDGDPNYYSRWYYYIIGAANAYATAGASAGSYKGDGGVVTDWLTYTPGTDRIWYFEWDDAGWVIEVRNADGTAITNGRAPKVAWSATYPGAGATAVQSGDALWLTFGDKYTDATFGSVDMRFKWIKLESVASVA